MDAVHAGAKAGPGDAAPMSVQLRQRHKFSRSRDGCLTCKYVGLCPPPVTLLFLEGFFS